MVKRCCKCKLVLDVSEFYRATKRPDGLQTVCKACSATNRREARRANPEHARRLQRARAARLKETNTDAYQRMLQRARDRYQSNRARARESARRWAAENQERTREIGRASSAARRARLRSTFIERVDAVVVYERDLGICALCGAHADRAEWELDHIVPVVLGGEHSYANTQVAHTRCNRSKGARLVPSVRFYDGDLAGLPLLTQ